MNEMSSILIRQKILGPQEYKLLWEKGKGFVVRKNGSITNYYGNDEKVARRRFSSKISRLKTKKGMGYTYDCMRRHPNG